MSALNAVSRARTKMADVVVTLKVMPDSPEVDLKVVEKKVGNLIAEFGGELGRVEKEPVGFGLVALKLFFVMPEAKGSTEPLEEQIKTLKEVGSVDVVDVRRAIG